MPLDPLADLRARLEKLETLLRSRFLERSSVDEGRMTFIKSELLMQGESRLNGEGTFTWTGPATIRGSLKIEGPAKVTGDMDIEGRTRLLSELIVEGGKITAGNIRIEDGKIYVGTGSAEIVIDGATGKITAGDMTMDPTVSGGALTFANGAQVFTDANTVQVFKGNSVVQVADGYAKLQNGGNVVQIDPQGIRMSPGAIPSAPGTGLPVPGVLIQAPDGYVRKSDGT